MTPRDRADRAKQILDDPVFTEALKSIRERIVSKLETVPVSDHDTEHELVLTLQLLQRIPAQFKAYTDELLIEEHKEQQNSFMDRMRQKFRA